MGPGTATWGQRVSERGKRRDLARQASRHGGTSLRKGLLSGPHLAQPSRGQRKWAAELSAEEVEVACCTLKRRGQTSGSGCQREDGTRGDTREGPTPSPHLFPALSSQDDLTLLTPRMGDQREAAADETFFTDLFPFSQARAFTHHSLCFVFFLLHPVHCHPHPPALGKLIHLCAVLAKSPSATLCV